MKQPRRNRADIQSTLGLYRAVSLEEAAAALKLSRERAEALIDRRLLWRWYDGERRVLLYELLAAHDLAPDRREVTPAQARRTGREPRSKL